MRSFGIFILFVVFFPLYFMMSRAGNERSFVVSILVTTLIAVMLRLLSLINDWTLYLCIALLAIAVFFINKDAAQFEQ